MAFVKNIALARLPELKPCLMKSRVDLFNSTPNDGPTVHGQSCPRAGAARARSGLAVSNRHEEKCHAY